MKGWLRQPLKHTVKSLTDFARLLQSLKTNHALAYPAP
jgi:hypothetical protein